MAKRIGRAQVEHERLFPWRQTYCRYLHVAEVAAEGPAAPTAWDGIGGRLKQTWVALSYCLAHSVLYWEFGTRYE